MNSFFIKIIIGVSLFILSESCSGEESANDKEIIIDFNNVRKPIKINNDIIFVDLSKGLTSDPEDVKINLNVFLNKIPDIKDKAVMFSAKQTNRIKPDLYELILDEKEFYWLLFKEDSRSLDYFTRFNFGSDAVKNPKLKIYFKDYNSDGENDHLTIIINLKGCVGFP